jgi:DNA helicase-2/ATP-dependent DNA helicase PcrA
MTPDRYQEAFFAEVERGAGNVALRAGPGSGKTTTIVEAGSRMPRSRLLYTAFARASVDALQTRLERGTVSTINSLGMAILRRRVPGNWQIDGSLHTKLAKELLPIPTGKEVTPAKEAQYRAVQGTIADTLKLAKNAVAETTKEICDIIWEQNLDFAPFDIREVAAMVMRGLDATRDGPCELADGKRYFSFDDQLWVPLIHGWQPTSFYDAVLIDEVQDLSHAKTEMAAAHSRGRVFVVGDPLQAIYGFAGVPMDAFDRVVDHLHAAVMPLSICYRCPRGVVALARAYNKELEPSPSALPGDVQHHADGLRPTMLSPSDVVISRSNAALFALWLDCLLAGVPARINGKGDEGGYKYRLRINACDVGNGSISAWRKALDAWVQERAEKLTEAGKPLDKLKDDFAVLQLLSKTARTVDDVRKNLAMAFASGGALLTTVHKYKGEEAARVWMLDHTFRQDDPEKGRYATQEHRNLRYVALTRSKHFLGLVELPTKEDDGASWNPPVVRAFR